MKRAQFFSVELVTVMLLFLTLFLTVLSIWNSQRTRLDKERLVYELELKAANIGELLVESPGSPTNWNTAAVEQFGLADEYHVVNAYKFNNLLTMINNSYDYTRELLGVSKYGLVIVLEDFNEAVIISAGLASGQNLAVWQENIVYEGRVLRLKVGVSG